jgi:tripartite motif-containing protein 71
LLIESGVTGKPNKSIVDKNKSFDSGEDRMKKYHRGWFNLIVLVSLAFTGAFTQVSAQAIQPVQRPHPAAAGSVPGVLAANAIQPGASGTSFRYLNTFGVTEVSYQADTSHLNSPNGLITDPAGNVYVVEEEGARLLKFDPNGNALWTVGKAGLNAWYGPTTFGWPREVAQDSSGNLWVADNDHVAVYDTNGGFKLFFPDQPWNAAPENQFGELRGVAFDSGGRLYLADANKNRVQVYTIGSDGIPVFAASLGSQGSALGQFDRPTQIVIDPTDSSLYVSDLNNFRVQKCTPTVTTWPWSWTCVNFHGGTQGPADNQLNYAYGLGMDASHNVLIVDSGNGRVKRCTPAGTCFTLIQASDWWPADVAVEGTNYVLVTDYSNHVIKKYDTSGNFLDYFAGTIGVPYVSDQFHYFRPQALAVDPAGNVYMGEDFGKRMFKFDPNGNVKWSVGTAGIAGDPPNLLCWPRAIAIGPDGKVYLAGCGEVRLFTANGLYLDRFFTGSNSGASGIAVDNASRIYVSDGINNQVKIYNSSFVLQQTIGTGAYGSGNDQFASPKGLTIDSSGNLYVADTDNCRIQKFSSSLQYLTTFGQTGVCAQSWENTALGHVTDVAVDRSGRIYVADSWLNRVQILDSAGNYLATIGNKWSADNGGLRDAESVDVDLSGNVYVADLHNGRIQKYTFGLPGWQQANVDGFGIPDNQWVSALEVFGGSLYAGVMNPWSGTSVYRSSDGSSWQQVTALNFGTSDLITGVIDMIVYNGYLYAGTGTWGNHVGAQLWRTQDGTHWLPVDTTSFGFTDGEVVGPFGISSAGGTTYLYVAVKCLASGARIYRSTSGDPGTWSPVVTGGLDAPSNNVIDSIIEWNGGLYASVENNTLGGRVWYSTNGIDWIQLGPAGLGDLNNIHIGAMTVFNGHIYAPTGNIVTGAQIYRLDNGNTWTPVMQNGFGSVNNNKIEGLSVHNGKLFASTNNQIDGMSLMVSDDGISWKPLIPSGFGTVNNTKSLWNTAVKDFNGTFYIGTENDYNGGQIWRYLEKQIYIPLIKR